MTKAPPRRESARAKRRMESPIEDGGVKRQLARLFGESLFGAWPELKPNLSDARQVHPPKRAFRAALAALVVVSAAFGVHSLLCPKFDRHDDPRRGQYVEDLMAFLNDGNLEQASQFAKLVQEHSESREGSPLDPNDIHLESIIAVEASLYRYYDGSPERLRRLRPYLDGKLHASPLRQIAQLTLFSREERASQLRLLEDLHNDRPDASELEYLLATAQEFRSDTKSSRVSWERVAKLQPTWLGHRFEQAWFELHQNRLPFAQQIALEMLQLEGNSFWSRLAASTTRVPDDAAARARSDASAPADTPVRRHFEYLVGAIEAAHRRDFAQAKEQIHNAASAIRFGAPFLFDAFDWCVAEREPALARELSNLPEWPRNSKVASAKLARLSNLPPTDERTERSTQPP